MPRRVYTYPAGMGWDSLNLITTIGSYLFALGVVLLLVNVAISLRRGRIAPTESVGAPTASNGRCRRLRRLTISS